MFQLRLLQQISRDVLIFNLNLNNTLPETKLHFLLKHSFWCTDAYICISNANRENICAWNIMHCSFRGCTRQQLHNSSWCVFSYFFFRILSNKSIQFIFIISKAVEALQKSWDSAVTADLWIFPPKKIKANPSPFMLNPCYQKTPQFFHLKELCKMAYSTVIYDSTMKHFPVFSRLLSSTVLM